MVSSAGSRWRAAWSPRAVRRRVRAGRGVWAARSVRGRPSKVQGASHRCAMALRAALDLGASTTPTGRLSPGRPWPALEVARAARPTRPTVHAL
jgi:hypothetical protein